MRRLRQCAVLFLLMLAACGQRPQEQEPPAPQRAVVEQAPPMRACYTIEQSSVQTLIGSGPLVTTADVLEPGSPGWSRCTYSHRDPANVEKLVIRVIRLSSGPAATQAHESLSQQIAGAQHVPNDPDDAIVWVEGANLNIQFHRFRVVTRRTLEGAVDTQARARLIAAPRWPASG